MIGPYCLPTLDEILNLIIQLNDSTAELLNDGYTEKEVEFIRDNIFDSAVYVPFGFYVIQRTPSLKDKIERYFVENKIM